jgi:hypothetical protein
MKPQPHRPNGHVDGVVVAGKDASLLVRAQNGQKFTIVSREVFTLTMK